MEVEFGAEVVKYRFCEAGNDRGRGAKQIVNHDFVFAGFEPGAGKIKRLIGTDVPKPAEAMAVHPDDALAPGAHVKKSIARIGDLDLGAPKGGTQRHHESPPTTS